MSTRLSRREFLRLMGLSLGALAFRPMEGAFRDATQEDLLRVTVRSVSVYSQPSDQSRIRFQRYRDELVNIYAEVESEAGPAYNPVWYRVWGGYIHRANTQRVRIQYNRCRQNCLPRSSWPRSPCPTPKPCVIPAPKAGSHYTASTTNPRTGSWG